MFKDVGRRIAILTALLAVLVAARASVSARACGLGVVSRVSGNGSSLEPIVSGDGRYVSFWSTASDLVAGDTNGMADIFVADRQTCVVERVSVGQGGVQANDASTSPPSLSYDGRFVAFASRATNLVPTDSNGVSDIFVRDRQLGVTLLVSITHQGGPANGDSVAPALTPDGRFVAFVSAADNLVATPVAQREVYLRDRVLGITERVSTHFPGLDEASHEAPAISIDARFVAYTRFFNGSDDLTADVKVRDRQAGTTTAVSVSSTGHPANRSASRPSISDDGRFIAFYSEASNLAPAKTNTSGGIFVRDRVAGVTELASITNTGGSVHANTGSVSRNGRYVAFSSPTAFLPGDTGTVNDVFVRDRQLAITRRVSVSATGVQGDGLSWGGTLSADGSVVAFHSAATNLTSASDTNGVHDIFSANWQFLPPPQTVDLIVNGALDTVTGWQIFATPDLSYFKGFVDADGLHFYREPPPPGTTNQAVVFQQTTAQLPEGAEIRARFDLGNTSSVRKRIAVLIHDADFSDLHVCTFWVAPGTPKATYEIVTHTTESWSNATISFYAATAGSAGGHYVLSNVDLSWSFDYVPPFFPPVTACTDPAAPTTASTTGPNLLQNAGFETGLPPWSLFGEITHLISGGVFHFIRPTSTPPAGVVLQPTGQPLPLHQWLHASFKLGNSSSVRKRVTVLLHDLDFSDLAACTFWLPPGQPLATYEMAAYVSEAWSNATLSVYPSTIGSEAWIQLDDVSFARANGYIIVPGTTCWEPAPARSSITMAAAPVRRVAVAGQHGSQPDHQAGGDDLTSGLVLSGGTARDALVWPEVFNLREATQCRLQLLSWLDSPAGIGQVQVSVDGRGWRTVAIVASSDGWGWTTIELSDLEGATLRVRFVLDDDSPRHGTWRIGNVRVDCFARPQAEDASAR